ncbi:MAG: zinc transporter ZupT [Anaerolineales bacterium]
MENLGIAFGLTILAGLATGIGSILAFATKRTNYRFLAISTGFSAGVMLYVSFVEIFIKGSEALIARYGQTWGQWINVASFFGGILLIGLIDNLIPAAENPHETHLEEEIIPIQDPSASTTNASRTPEKVESEPPSGGHEHEARQSELMRMGLFTALAIGIHNFPEGLATFLAALQDPGLGLAIAVAIALHNIPEGISVSVPIFYATGDRKKAFIYSFLSGLSEPVGAAIGYLALRSLVGSGTDAIPSEVMGILFGGVAGIMVYISLDELLPTSRAYGKGHDSLFGLVAGMLVMALSLLLM